MTEGRGPKAEEAEEAEEAEGGRPNDEFRRARTPERPKAEGREAEGRGPKAEEAEGRTRVLRAKFPADLEFQISL